MTAYERAILEQIDFLRDELVRYQEAQQRAARPLPTEDDEPIVWAMRDARFLQWRLLRRQLESEPRR